MRTKFVFKQICTGGVCFPWHDHFARLRAVFVKPSEIPERRRISSPAPAPALQRELNMLQLCCKKHEAQCPTLTACNSYCCLWCPCRCEIDTPQNLAADKKKLRLFRAEWSGWQGTKWGVRSSKVHSQIYQLFAI